MPKHINRLTSGWILSLDPSVSTRTRLATAKDMISSRDGTDSLLRDAQAACGFSCSASKCTPFFQTIKVIAAIFRAKVRRAIAGLMPLASKAS